MRSRKLVQICQAVSFQHKKLQPFRFLHVKVMAHSGGRVTDQPKFELFDIANVVRSSSGSSSVHLSLCFCSCPVGNCLIRCVGGSTSENLERSKVRAQTQACFCQAEIYPPSLFTKKASKFS